MWSHATGGPYSPEEFNAIDDFLEQVTRTAVMRSWLARVVLCSFAFGGDVFLVFYEQNVCVSFLFDVVFPWMKMVSW